jgi:hypothetical protein
MVMPQLQDKVIYEIVQMAQIEGYKTGGTIHIVTIKLVLQQIILMDVPRLLHGCR